MVPLIQRPRIYFWITVNFRGIAIYVIFIIIYVIAYYNNWKLVMINFVSYEYFPPHNTVGRDVNWQMPEFNFDRNIASSALISLHHLALCYLIVTLILLYIHSPKHMFRKPYRMCKYTMSKITFQRATDISWMSCFGPLRISLGKG